MEFIGRKKARAAGLQDPFCSRRDFLLRRAAVPPLRQLEYMVLRMKKIEEREMKLQQLDDTKEYNAIKIKLDGEVQVRV